MNKVQEIPFEYFKEVYKRKTNNDSICKTHKDIFVSYCIDTKEPLCVKCILNYSKKNQNFNIVSLNDLKGILNEEIKERTKEIQKNYEKLEQMKLINFNETEMKNLKQKGLRKLQETKETIIQSINQTFEQMKEQWFRLFEENFNLQKKKDKMIHELNLIIKIFIKSQNNNQLLGNNGSLKFEQLQDLMETTSMIKNPKYISKKVKNFMIKLEKLSKIQKYPELSINNIVMNKIYEELKYLFDYNFDYSIERLDAMKVFRFKMPDFFKQSKDKQSDKYDQQSKYIPIIAKSRRLMVFDLNLTSFKELLLSEIHSIPQGNQICVSPINQQRFFIIGGHLFKNASNKLFEMDTLTQEFKILESMLHPRWMHRATVYKQWIYVTGGTDNEKETPIGYVERFDTNKLVWEKLSDLINPRHSHCAVLYESYDKNKPDKKAPTIYIFGGIGIDKRYVTQIEKFDVQRNAWTEINFQNSFNFTVIGSFGHQINDKEIILFGGFKYLQNQNSKINQNKKQTFIQYPFNNSYVFTFNVEEDIVTCNNYYHLPYGVFNSGNQVIYHQKQIYFSGNLNTNSFYTNIVNAEFTQESNAQKIVGVIKRDKIKVLDYVLFQQIIIYDQQYQQYSIQLFMQFY